MSIVLGGQRYEVPGVRTISFMDDPVHVPRTRGTPRRLPIQMIVMHSTGMHAPTVVLPGSKTPSNPWRFASDNATNDRVVSWDATIRTDGVVLWQNDPLETFTWHATQLNPRSIGIELEQGPNGELYDAQRPAFVALVNFLTAKLGIQRQVPWHDGAPDARVLARLRAGGADVVGVVGHRNGDDNRSDPGDAPYQWLRAVGYEGFDLAASEDKSTWATRQAALGLPADGVPGATTVAALARAGRSAGLWVSGQRTDLVAVVGVVLLGTAAWLAWRMTRKA